MRRTRRLVPILTVALSLVGVAAADAAQPAPMPVCQAKQCTITFPYVGDAYTWTVPSNLAGPLSFDLKGAKGGTPSGSPGGSGARVQAQYTPTAGEVLTVTPGGAGGWSGAWTPGGGGFNGGAAGYYYYTTADGFRTNTFGGGGGGASDVRSGGTDLANRILVAGGGGGGAYVEDYQCYGLYCDPGRYYGTGGDAGRLGANGTGSTPGAGATQSAGGAGGRFSSYAVGGAGMLGLGGYGNGDGNYGGGGGGGGGYYGGGGGTFGNKGASGGGGGSSWAAPSLSAVSYTAGANAGDGQIVVSFPIGDAPMLMAASPALWIKPGVAYSYTFTATGDPQPTFSVASGALPSGLSLDPATGVLSGTPTTVGASTFTVAATNAVSTVTSGPLSITVGTDPMFTAMNAPPTGIQNMPYTFTFAAGGAPAPTISLAGGVLPPGLDLKAGSAPGTAVLSGTATQAGSYTFTLKAANGSTDATQSVTIEIMAPAPTVSRAPMIAASGGNGAMSVSLTLAAAPGSPIVSAGIDVYANPSLAFAQQAGLEIAPRSSAWVLIGKTSRTVGTGGARVLGVNVRLNRRGVYLAAHTYALPVRIGITATSSRKQTTTSLLMGNLTLRTTVIRPAGGTFATSSATLNAAGRAYVKRVARIVKGTVAAITCVGHADANGTSTANTVLGQQRAEEVCDALRQAGVRAKVWRTSTRGESDPRAQGGGAAAEARNRRVETIVTQ